MWIHFLPWKSERSRGPGTLAVAPGLSGFLFRQHDSSCEGCQEPAHWNGIPGLDRYRSRRDSDYRHSMLQRACDFLATVLHIHANGIRSRLEDSLIAKPKGRETSVRRGGAFLHCFRHVLRHAIALKRLPRVILVGIFIARTAGHAKFC